MIRLADFSPLQGQYVHMVNSLDIKSLLKSNVGVIYLKDPEVNKELIDGLKKLLNRKRPFLIYIESPDNHIIKEELSKHPKRNMISYIYDFMEMNKSGKLTIYDYIRVDLENNLGYWEKLLKFSKKVPCIYLIDNAPDLSQVKSIPENYRFENATNKQEI